MPKQYQISDLFKTSWLELTTREHATMLMHLSRWKEAKKKLEEQTDAAKVQSLYGHYSILILKTLRKNKTAVSKINVAQAVDCINDIIGNFDSPWYHFPPVKIGEKEVKPEFILKYHTFGMLCRMDSLFSKWAIQEYHDSKAIPPIGPLGPVAIQFQNELLGIIYCDPKQYDETLIEARGKEIGKSIKMEARHVAISTFANVKKFIIDGAPNLFAKPEEEEQPENEIEDKAPQDTEPMWENLLFAFAESEAYKGMDKAKAAPMYEALNYLEKKIKDAPKPKSNGKE